MNRLFVLLLFSLLAACSGSSVSEDPVATPVAEQPPADSDPDDPSDNPDPEPPTEPPTEPPPEPPVEPPPAPPQPPAGAWFAGDGHVHNDHSNDGSFTRQGLDDRGPGTTDILQQATFANTQGLDWMPLTDHRTFNQHWDPQWTSDSVLLITGEEANGSPHCTVFGHIDTAVQGASPNGDPGFRTVQQSLWDVRAQGALWNQAHPDRRSYDRATDTPNAFASQVGQSLAEVWNRGENPEAEIDYAENRWNAGWRFGVVGASDNHDRALWAASGPGSPTTFVFAPDGSERGILSGLAAGRTVVSSGPTGPFVTLEADLQGDGIFEGIVGSELLAEPGQDIVLRLRAQRATGFRVMLYGAPGRDDAELNPVPPVLEFQAQTLDEVRELTVRAPDSGHAWWYVMVRGAGAISGLEAPNDPSDQLLGMTSPIFVSTTGAVAEPQAEIAVPADAAQPDGAIAAFAGDDFYGFGDVAASGAITHLVAEQHTQTTTQVVYRQRSATGEFSTPLVISDDSAAARFPRVAARGDMVWVVWQDERAGQVPRRPAIYLRRSDDGGNTWAASQRLSNGEQRAEHPNLAITPSGEPVIVWHDNSDSGAMDVMALVLGRDADPVNLSSAGKATMMPDPSDTRSARYPSSVFPDVAVRDDGLIAVSWHDNRLDSEPGWTGARFTGEGTDPDDWEVFVATRPPGEAWLPFVNASGDNTTADWHTAVAFDADGQLRVAWDAKRNNSSSGRDLYVRSTFSADDGLSFKPAINVTDEATPGMARRPIFGTDAADALVLTWADSRSADWRWRSFAAPVTATGFGEQTVLTGPGNATFQRLDAGRLVFTSDRLLQRVQRDRRFAVLIVGLP